MQSTPRSGSPEARSYPRGVRPRTLDHIALWVADRERMVATAVEKLGVRVIEQTDRFTLLGADARRGKLTLFDAEGPREPGALDEIGLRVSSLDGRAPAGGSRRRAHGRLVEATTDSELDLDHVALVSADPEAAAERLGAAWLRADGRRKAGGRRRLPRARQGEPGQPERPLLNHIGVLVDSVDEQQAAVEELGVEIDNFVDAPNTVALFVWGPDRVKLEYIEHKPSFSLT